MRSTRARVTVIATDTLGHQTYLTQDQFTLDKETALYAIPAAVR